MRTFGIIIFYVLVIGLAVAILYPYAFSLAVWLGFGPDEIRHLNY